MDSLGERARAELRRIDGVPPLSPEDIRRKRKELGARQKDLAIFSGLSLGAVNRAENGGPSEPRTLKRIAAGIEAMQSGIKS